MVALVIVVLGSSILLGTAATALGLTLVLRLLEKGVKPLDTSTAEPSLLTEIY